MSLLVRYSSPIWSPTKEEFQILVSSCSTFKEVLVHFGYKGTSSYQTLRKRFKYDNIDISHFEESRKKLISANSKKFNPGSSLESILVKNSYYDPQTLKKRLFNESLLEEKCYSCKIGPFWNGQTLTLQLDHINGDNNDNRLSNLRVLCPNCHTQTSTYGGKNNKVKRNCASCKSEITRFSRSGLCIKCSSVEKGIRRRKNLGNIRPSKEKLFQNIFEIGFVKTGKLYKVSDNAIRKWCKAYEMPTNIADFKNLILT